MIQEESKKRVDNGRLYDFWQYRKKKPFFTKPLSIRIGDPLHATYEVVGNIVYQDKQIIGLKRQSESGTILIVEAKIEDGKFTAVLRVPEPLLKEVRGLFIDALTERLQ